VDQEYIPEAWRTVTSEGDNLYKFLDPSKFPMEMVSEALQFWYKHQEKGKVAFHFKSFLEGKGVREAPPRKKIKVYTVGKGKRSKGPRKGNTFHSSTDSSRNPGIPAEWTGFQMDSYPFRRNSKEKLHYTKQINHIQKKLP